MPIQRTVVPLVFALAAVTVAALVAPPTAVAQEAATSSEPETAVQAMEPLAWLVGDWEGEGWIQLGPAERQEFIQTEHVEPAFGGRILLVEGIGRGRVPDGEGPIEHHAFGVLSWDAEENSYRFDTYRAGDRGVDADATLEEGVFTWGFDTPGGTVRFVLRETESGEWHETGAFSPDQGSTWNPFFEMTLARVEGSTGDIQGGEDTAVSDR